MWRSYVENETTAEDFCNKMATSAICMEGVERFEVRCQLQRRIVPRKARKG
jgi:hypothetical protein